MGTDTMQPDRECHRARRLLAQDGSPAETRVQRHLRGCATCREFAAEFDRLTRGLAGSREIEPPAALDHRLRSLLLEQPRLVRAVLRPGFATGLAVAAMVSFTLFVATSLAQSGAGEMGPLIAVVVTWAYLALSAAATLPLLLLTRTRLQTDRLEVRS